MYIIRYVTACSLQYKLTRLSTHLKSFRLFVISIYMNLHIKLIFHIVHLRIKSTIITYPIEHCSSIEYIRMVTLDLVFVSEYTSSIPFESIKESIRIHWIVWIISDAETINSIFTSHTHTCISIHSILCYMFLFWFSKYFYFILDK